MFFYTITLFICLTSTLSSVDNKSCIYTLLSRGGPFKLLIIIMTLFC